MNKKVSEEDIFSNHFQSFSFIQPHLPLSARLLRGGTYLALISEQALSKERYMTHTLYCGSSEIQSVSGKCPIYFFGRYVYKRCRIHQAG